MNALRLISTQSAKAVLRAQLAASVAALPKPATAFDLVVFTEDQRAAFLALDAAMNPLRRTFSGNATMPGQLSLVPDQCLGVASAAIKLMQTIKEEER